MSERPIDPATGRRAAGRPRTIDRDRIGDAALAEIENLTLTAVARRLGVGKSALYHHIEGRADLVMIAADRALSTWQRPSTKLSAANFLMAFAMSLQDCLDAHPGLDVALLELHDSPPTMTQALYWAVDVLGSYGLDPQEAGTAAHLVANLAHEDARHRRALEPGQWPADWLTQRIELVSRGLSPR